MTYRDRPAFDPAHQHFCSYCFSHRGKANQRGSRGWWRCIDRKCVRPNQSYCPEHEQLDSARLRGAPR